jgi:hypothetical protein
MAMRKKKNKVESIKVELIKPRQVKKKALIYCGPDIRNIVQQYAVFNGDLPAEFKAHVEKCQYIKRLLVPISDLSKIKTSINEVGTSENVFYNKILQYRKELNK